MPEKLFMSAVPRPYILPLALVAVKGLVSQCWPSTGTTSVWPESITPPSTLGPIVAKRLALGPLSSATIWLLTPC